MLCGTPSIAEDFSWHVEDSTWEAVFDQRVMASLQPTNDPGANFSFLQPVASVGGHNLRASAMNVADGFDPDTSNTAPTSDACPLYEYNVPEQPVYVAPTIRSTAAQTSVGRAILQGGVIIQAYHQHGSRKKSTIFRSFGQHNRVAEKLLALIGDKDSLRMAKTLFAPLNGAGWTGFSPSRLDLPGVFRQLKSLDREQYQAVIRKRMVQLRLRDHWDLLCTEISQAVRALKESGEPAGGKVESQALDELVEKSAQVFEVTSTPEETSIPKALSSLDKTSTALQKSKERKVRKSLQNQLQAAKHWAMARQKFGIGIIALIPVGRDNISNTA